MPLNTIMLVDDEPRLLAGIRRRLSSDFDIVTFERGADAIDYLSQPNDVKVIVADMQMPEMNGIELLKKVQDISPDIRRLMLTGNSDQETAMSAINEGRVFRFIRKPCETSELKIIINQAIEDYEFQKADLAGLVKSEAAAPEAVQLQHNFLSVMNDELRTPLSQIITMSEVLNRDAVALEPQKLSGFLTQINKSAEFALSQVDRILEFTRLQSPAVENENLESSDIVAVFHKVVNSFKAEANEKLVTFSIESLRKTADVLVPAHSVELMLRELVQNALKFSPFGGHISIMLRYDKDRVAARITDGGPGLSKDFSQALSASVSAPFKAENSELTRAHPGLGLGLSLVRSVSEKYDVLFDLQSMRSGGSAAVLIFKRAPLTPASIEAPSSQTSEENLRLAS